MPSGVSVGVSIEEEDICTADRVAFQPSKSWVLSVTIINCIPNWLVK